jgi:hypothetical protein
MATVDDTNTYIFLAISGALVIGYAILGIFTINQSAQPKYKLLAEPLKNRGY